MKLVTYPDRDLMMMDLAHKLASELGDVLRAGGRASLAVPGGTTPGPIFDVLCAADIDWSRVDVMLTDERCVPETSERSNSRLVKERLLTERAAGANWVPLYGPEGAEARAERIALALPLSVVLLGMGADMHTASLFPGSPDLEAGLAPDALALVEVAGPDPDEPRVSLPAWILAGAVNRHVVITGAEKRSALERAQELNDPMQAPIVALLSGTTIHWAE